MNKKTIQSANLHAATTHAQAKADAVEGKSSHTPGPWVPCPGLAGSRFRIETMRVNNDCEPVAECKGPDREANARLIAAAPELLDALEACLGPLQDEYNRAIQTSHRTAAAAAFLDARELVRKFKKGSL